MERVVGALQSAAQITTVFDQPGQPCRHGRVAGQVSNQSVTQCKTRGGYLLGEILGFHPRHVDINCVGTGGRGAAEAHNQDGVQAVQKT